MHGKTTLQKKRFWFQSGFFLLFVLAPPLNLFRFDLTQNHLFFLGMPWTLGIDDFIAGHINSTQAVTNIFLKLFLPLAIVGGGLIYTAWRFGRLYCGWLCPHFSVVEMVNKLMMRASGKPTIWESNPLPRLQADGSHLTPHAGYWPIVALVALFFAFVWALTLLSYLLPPFELYSNLWHGTLTGNQLRFLGVGTTLLFIEFMFARHLFCRFGCAVGLFQILAWVANNKAMVVGFEKDRAKLCSNCNNACDNICPMRLKPRSLKRKMFTCTECAQCISACSQVQTRNSGVSLLKWVHKQEAISVATGRPTSANIPNKEVQP